MRVTHRELDESWNSVDGKYELQLGQKQIFFRNTDGSCGTLKRERR